MKEGCILCPCSKTLIGPWGYCFVDNLQLIRDFRSEYKIFGFVEFRYRSIHVDSEVIFQARSIGTCFQLLAINKCEHKFNRSTFRFRIFRSD